MKKETKIIIIGIIITILTILIATGIFFLIYKNQKSEIQDSNTNSSKENETSINNKNPNESLPNDEETENKEEKIITAYLFRGEECPFCEKALESLKTIAMDHPYLEVKIYEVWKDKNNRKLMDLVAEEFEIEISSSVPLIVIGNEYARRGYSDGTTDSIKNEIERSYKNADYYDVVDQIIKENNDLVLTEEKIK